MRLAVREQPVDDDADDGEDEDNKAPQQLVRGRAARLEDLNCAATSVSAMYN